MACPNFKKGLKMVSGPLGVNLLKEAIRYYGLICLVNPTLKKQFTVEKKKPSIKSWQSRAHFCSTT
jgi:hypothetical protein